MNTFRKKTRRTLTLFLGRKTYVFRRFRGALSTEKDALCARESVNCDQRGGVLTSGLGMSDSKDEMGRTMELFYDGVKIKEMGFYRRKGVEGYNEELWLLQERNALAKYDEEQGKFVKFHSFSASEDIRMVDFVDEYKNFVKVFYGKEGAYVYRGETFEQVYSGAVQSACACKGRIFFAVKPYSIVYSKVGDSTSFTQSVDEGGRILSMTDKGQIVGLQALGNCVCVFLERGLFRLKVDGSAREFVLEEIPFCGGQVFVQSIKEVEGRLYFLTEKGVFVFDGKEVRSAFEGMEIQPDKTGEASAVVTQNRYILRYADRKKGERVIALDVDGDGSELFALPLLCGAEGQVFSQKGEILQRLSEESPLPTGEEYRFLSECVEFGLGEQAISSVRLDGEGRFSLTLRSDTGTQTLDVAFVDGEATIKPTIKGKTFSFEFILTKGTKIKKMEVDVEKLKGVKGYGD